MEIAVSVGDRKVLKDSNDTLQVNSVGTGIGITAYDSQVPVGGILHCLLPRGPATNKNLEERQFIFAESGIPAFFDEIFALGAKKERLKCVVAGGAQFQSQDGKYNVGKENCETLERILGEMGIHAEHADLGGSVTRTMKLDIKSGVTSINTLGQGEIEV